MATTLLGIVAEVIGQPANAPPLIVCNPSLKVTVSRRLQPWKQYVSIVLMFPGIVTEINSTQFAKAEVAIALTGTRLIWLGITTLVAVPINFVIVIASPLSVYSNCAAAVVPDKLS